ncbi:MAG: dihydrofolate reductase [Phycisphaeraceae bacterium]|nr:dihydrofolate reductase [Phycisphaeraceae bacterium]
MSQLQLAQIYARSENHVIGADGRIPWRLPDDFKHFKRTTMGCPIIMGRKTYEDHESALPGRLNLVITSNAGYQAAGGIEVVTSLDAAIGRAAQDNDLAFIIGGVGLFTQTFDRVQTVYETVVHTEIEGDAVLPAFDFTGWRSKVLQEHPADGRHNFAFTVRRWDRS